MNVSQKAKFVEKILSVLIKMELITVFVKKGLKKVVMNV